MKKLLILCLIIVFIISISFGKSFISIWNVKPEQLTLLYQIRLPHAILAFICGASLSVAGSVYQGLFRNNLASPYTLGIASGASLGAYLAYLFNFPFIFTNFSKEGVFVPQGTPLLQLFPFKREAWNHEIISMIPGDEFSKKRHRNITALQSMFRAGYRKVFRSVKKFK